MMPNILKVQKSVRSPFPQFDNIDVSKLKRVSKMGNKLGKLFSIKSYQSPGIKNSENGKITNSLNVPKIDKREFKSHRTTLKPLRALKTSHKPHKNHFQNFSHRQKNSHFLPKISSKKNSQNLEIEGHSKSSFNKSKIHNTSNLSANDTNNEEEEDEEMDISQYRYLNLAKTYSIEDLKTERNSLNEAQFEATTTPYKAIDQLVDDIGGIYSSQKILEFFDQICNILDSDFKVLRESERLPQLVMIASGMLEVNGIEDYDIFVKLIEILTSGLIDIFDSKNDYDYKE